MQRHLAISSLAALLLLPACVSTISKDEATQQLLALEKNRAVRVETLSMHPPTASGPVVEDRDREPIRVRYRVHPPLEDALLSGSGDPPIVMLHGTPQNLFVWNEIIDGTDDAAGLARTRKTIAVDLPGHGMTDASPPYSWKQMTRFVNLFLAKIGVDRVVLVGSSYGGEVAWRTAVEFPDLVERLVLIGSSGYPRKRKGADALLRTPVLGELALAFANEGVVRKGLLGAFEDPSVVTKDLVTERYILLRTKGNRQAIIAMTRAEKGDGSALIGRIEQPTLIIWGAKDPLFPEAEHAKLFDTDIGPSQLHVAPDCGHSVQMEKPDFVIEKIRPFLGWSPPPPPKPVKPVVQRRPPPPTVYTPPPPSSTPSPVYREPPRPRYVIECRFFDAPDLAYLVDRDHRIMLHGPYGPKVVGRLTPPRRPDLFVWDYPSNIGATYGITRDGKIMDYDASIDFFFQIGVALPLD